ncbi:MAG: FxsA family protein [Spirochaetia bacterium]
MRLFLRFIEKDYLFKLIFALALYAIVPFVEILFVIYLGYLIGNWLVVVLAVLAGLPGVLIAQSQLQEILPRLRGKIRGGQYPGAEMVDLLGILVAGVFLVTPGFITDVLGYLLLVPVLRTVLARALAKKLDRGMKELSNYLRLREL